MSSGDSRTCFVNIESFTNESLVNNQVLTAVNGQTIPMPGINLACFYMYLVQIRRVWYLCFTWFK